MNSALEAVRRVQEEAAAAEEMKQTQLEALRKQYADLAEKRTQAANAERQRQQEQRDLLARQRQEKQEAELKAQALASWRRTGGDDATFETAWPDMKRELLASRVAEEMKQAQLQSARQTHQRF